MQYYIYIYWQWVVPKPHDFPIGDGTMPILADFQPEGWDEDAESCSICHALLGRRRETRCFFCWGETFGSSSCLYMFTPCVLYPKNRDLAGYVLPSQKDYSVCIYICLSLSLCVCVQTEYLSVESSLQKSSFDLFFGAANLRVFWQFHSWRSET